MYEDSEGTISITLNISKGRVVHKTRFQDELENFLKNSDSLQDDGVVVEIVDVIVEIVDVIVESESNSYEDIEKNIAELQHLLKDENFQSEKSQQAIIRSIEFLNSQQKQSL